MLQLFFNRSINSFTGCAHDLMSGSVLLSFFLVPGNTAIIQSMLGTSSPDNELVSQYNHWYTLCVGHTSLRNLTQNTLPAHSIRITKFMVLIQISYKASSTSILTLATTEIDLPGSQDPCILTVLPWLLRTPINLTGGKITTGTGLYLKIFYFMNRTTGWWSALSFTISECAAKDTSVDTFSMSLYPTIMWIFFIAT